MTKLRKEAEKYSYHFVVVGCCVLLCLVVSCHVLLLCVVVCFCVSLCVLVCCCLLLCVAVCCCVYMSVVACCCLLLLCVAMCCCLCLCWYRFLFIRFLIYLFDSQKRVPLTIHTENRNEIQKNSDEIQI